MPHRHPFKLIRRIRGFTLLELMTALAVSAILLSSAIPAFGRFSLEQRLNAESQRLFLDLQFARATAVNRNRAVTVCPADGEYCDDRAAWHEGWIVFVDRNQDRQRQTGEPLLRTALNMRSHQAHSAPSRRQVRFFPNGTAVGTNLSIRVCGPANDIRWQKISVSNSGRIRHKRQPADLPCRMISASGP